MQFLLIRLNPLSSLSLCRSLSLDLNTSSPCVIHINIQSNFFPSFGFRSLVCVYVVVFSVAFLTYFLLQFPLSVVMRRCGTFEFTISNPWYDSIRKVDPVNAPRHQKWKENSWYFRVRAFKIYFMAFELCGSMKRYFVYSLSYWVSVSMLCPVCSLLK